MDTSILTTKLYIPPPRPGLVSRPRLNERLNSTVQRKLTIISAPAGFGKTTLVSSWLHQLRAERGTIRDENKQTKATWLSLDRADNNPARFLAYFIAALQQLNPTIGQTTQKILQASQLPRLDILLPTLLNEIAALPSEFVLVLDDYHIIEEQAIHEALDFLLAHWPSHAHLVIASRSQPPLTLSRLRGQAQLLELNSADLRFTAVEVEQFFKGTMQLDMSPADRIALEMRTEGWIAGLQLAAIAMQSPLSLQTQQNKSAFITSFTGADRYIGDYLFEEVLQCQSEEMQHFLLSTSVVDTLCGELCDAILAENGSQKILEKLDSLQLFIVPLDNQRQWYRYHHLFVDLLRHHLQRTYPEQIFLLHRRASLWFEQQNRFEDAIRHGLKAQDFERTAGLLEMAFQQRDWVQHDMRHLLEWFEALPETVTQARPKLELGYAWLLLEIFSDQWARIEFHLKRVENILTTPETNLSFSNQETRQMLAAVDLLRANHARHSGQPARIISLCQQALNRLPGDEIYLRSGAIAHLASAYENLGSMKQAGQLYSESIGMCRAANNIDGLLFASARLIELLSLSGQLRQAEIVFGQAREYADKRTGPDMGLVYINMGDVFREQNQLEQAKTYLEQGLILCRPFEGWYAGVTAGVISMARVLMAEGRLDKAMNVLLEIEKQPLPAAPLEHARLESFRARLLLAQGNFNAAARWARRSGLSATDETDYTREFDMLTLTRVLLAQASLNAQGIHPLSIATDPVKDAGDLLEHLHSAALSGERIGRVIEICLLQALMHALRQKTAEALKRLEEALNSAEPEGYVRLFADEGLPLYRLLTLLLTKPLSLVSTDYVHAILAAFPMSVRQSIQASSLAGTTLTERELKALRLLATELSIEDIATEMIISVSSVRTYAKRIYSKLNVHSRAEAVYRAKELKLL